MSTLDRLAATYVRERTKNKTLARPSARNARYVLNTFVAIAPPDPARIRPRHVAKWAGSRDLSPATLRNQISTVRAFCRWLVLHEHVDRDPTVGMARPKEPERMPRALPADHVGAVLAVCPDERGRLIVTLMVELGLRRAEVAALALGDIDHRAGIVLVHGKGGKQRWLPLTASARRSLADYLRVYPATTGPLIRSYRDQYAGLTPHRIGMLVSRWMTLAGVKAAPNDGVSAHALRHTAASDVLDAGADVRQVQVMLGHASLQMTQRYLRRPDAAQLLYVMEGRRYEHT